MTVLSHLLAKSAVETFQSPAVVTIEDLEKRRERGGAAFVLRVPRFQLLPGTFVAIVGASGCGKSTLLDVLSLILQPDCVKRFEFRGNSSANIDVAALWANGDERALASLRATQLGYVLQTGGLLPFLAVRENISLPGRIKAMSGVLEEVERLTAVLGIADCLEVKPQYLSGGQRQRVAIARALVHRPSLVLADEPTAAVDENRASQIVRDFRRLTNEHETTVVMVTHNRDLVLPVADAVYGFELIDVSNGLTRSTCLPMRRLLTSSPAIDAIEGGRGGG